VWNRTHIRAVQITMAEDFGVAGRGAFYEEAGCVRDVVQNHLLQILACLTMDPPQMQVYDSMRDEKSRVLKAVRPLTRGDIVRGQFNGYRKEKGVACDSDVETYAAVRLFIDTWRWADVPFFMPHSTQKSIPRLFRLSDLPFRGLDESKRIHWRRLSILRALRSSPTENLCWRCSGEGARSDRREQAGRSLPQAGSAMPVRRSHAATSRSCRAASRVAGSGSRCLR